MDYFSVIVLIIVTFVFISDRSVKSIDELKDGKINADIIKEINSIKENLEIFDMKSQDINYSKLFKFVKDSQKEYILLKNKKLNLNNYDLDTIIANYIISGKRPCGFNLIYEYQERKWSLKKLYIDIINYLNIFNKNDLGTYGVITYTKSDCSISEKNFKQKLVSYTPSKYTHIQFTKEEIKTSYLKKVYISKLTKANVSISLKILLLIISGSIITTNLIYSIFNVNNNISGLVISSVIYYCYSYIIRYIYKPIGRQRIIATYIFPIYFIAYAVVGIYTLISKVIKKVHAS